MNAIRMGAAGVSGEFLAAAVQMAAGTDKAANLAKAEQLIGEAARRGAGFVALPEVFNHRGHPDGDAAAAEAVPGTTSDFLAELARRHAVYLLGGSILEHSERPGLSFNTSLLFDPAGALVARYRKIHLFDVDLPGEVQLRESATRSPGEQVVVADTPLARFGLSVCYDLRFPELYRALAIQGAQVLCVPAAFLLHTGKDHWEPLLRARAIENGCYVVAPNQVGSNRDAGVATYGRSMIVDPWGNVLARAEDRECVVVAPIDLAWLGEIRRRLPCLEHRRLEGAFSPRPFAE